MEAPLEFRVPSLTLPVALEIGYLVFHALNYMGILFAGLIILAACFGCLSQNTLFFTQGAVLVLAIQTALLYTQLDARTLALINGLEASSTPYHIIYIGVEIIKLLFLYVLALYQLKNFKEYNLSLSG